MDMEEREAPMKKLNLLLTTTASVFLLTACGSDSDDKDSTIFEGSWQQKEFCERDGNESSTTVLTLKAGKVTTLITDYNDSSCQNKLRLNRLTGNYFLQQEVTLADGKKAQRVMVKVNKLEIAPPAEEYVNSANNSKFCGYNDWKLNQYKDVTDCENFNFKAVDEKDILRVENNTLQFGDDDSPKEDGYPTKLEQDPGLVRS